MVEKLEVVHMPDMAVVLDREPQPLASAVSPRARLEDQQIADYPGAQAPGIPAQRGADEVVVSGPQERNVTRRVAQERIAVLITPALVNQVSVPQVLDSDAAQVERAREQRAGFG